MRIHNVAVTLTQRDLEEAANEWLPDGYALERLHVQSAGILASLKTPLLRLEVWLRLEAGLAPGVFVFSLEASKGLKVPRRVIQMALQKLAVHLPRGVAVSDHQIVLTVNELWAPFVSAASVELTLRDGELTLVAEPLLIPTQPPGMKARAQGEMAL